MTIDRATVPNATSRGDFDYSLLDEQVMPAMEKHQVPGVAVGIIQGDQEYTAGYGVTNIENPLPVTADTLFQIGSTTKTVTGTAAMLLVEQGKLDLDVPIRTYLPELQLADPDVAARVTLRHVFTHTGGWVGDYFDDFGRGEDSLAKIVANLASLPQMTPLGDVWSYNNAGFYLAGRVLEVVTGQPYETVAKELVLDPLGMTMSFFFAEDVITYRVAVGHTVPFEDGNHTPQVEREWALARTGNPVGGIISTARDQLRYARFHMGDGTAPDGTRLLKQETMATMQTPVVQAANGDQFGITWFIREVGETKIVRHGGATKSQLSAFLLVPERNFALTVLTNGNKGGFLGNEITKWALEHYLNIEEPEPEPLERSEEELRPYVGNYRAALSDLELRIENGVLVLQITPKGGFPKPSSPPSPAQPPMRIALRDEDRMVIVDEPSKGTQAEVLRDPEGNIAWIRLGGRVHRRDQ